MKRLPVTFLGVAMASLLTTAFAVDGDAVIGGALGGAAGAAVGSELGGRGGAIAGSAVGAALGTAIATDKEKEPTEVRSTVVEEHEYHHGGPPPHAYREPPGHVKHRKHRD